MKLLDNQSDDISLTGFGTEAVCLIKDQSYRELADRFSYALAFGKDPADAIRGDIDLCLQEAGDEAILSASSRPNISIKHFKPSNASPLAVVECFLPLSVGSGQMLVELVVTTDGLERHVTLEQISYAPI
ncbi:MAG TPA: hypothetical protein VNV60_03810 [Holophagaceae bacterium]|jgi:hypothetical protein|nr:hypothetical protein [Holophagaceae bacterium]